MLVKVRGEERKVVPATRRWRGVHPCDIQKPHQDGRVIAEDIAIPPVFGTPLAGELHLPGNRRGVMGLSLWDRARTNAVAE